MDSEFVLIASRIWSFPCDSVNQKRCCAHFQSRCSRPTLEVRVCLRSCLPDLRLCCGCTDTISWLSISYDWLPLLATSSFCVLKGQLIKNDIPGRSGIRLDFPWIWTTGHVTWVHVQLKSKTCGGRRKMIFHRAVVQNNYKNYNFIWNVNAIFVDHCTMFRSICIVKAFDITKIAVNPSSFSCFQNILSQPKRVGVSMATLRSSSRVALPSRCVTFALATVSWLPQRVVAHWSTARSCPFWTASPTPPRSSTPLAPTPGSVSLWQRLTWSTSQTARWARATVDHTQT